MTEKESVFSYLKENGKIDQATALEQLGVKNVRNVIGYLKKDGVEIDTVNPGSKNSYYTLRAKTKKHKKLLEVPDKIHAEVKRRALESTLNGKAVLEKDLYVQAIEIGLKHMK